MAERNYLVDGVSGAGKSSVYEELIRRGYKAVTTDRAWKRVADPGASPGLSMWHEHKALGELESPDPDVLFVCGSCGNRERFLPYFTKVFVLRIDDDTMRRRLQERTNNDYGKQREELELMLALNRSDERLAGAIDVDATRPLGEVVDELLRLADCPPVNGDSPPAWSRRASETVQSFVIPEAALRVVRAGEPADELRDVLGREATTRLDYAWSGTVLATLLRYLDEEGISLHSERADLREGTVVVFTSDHRERYLDRLDPARFDGAALRRYYEELGETTAVGVEYALLDGIAFFRDTLTELEPASVAVLVAGRPARR